MTRKLLIAFLIASPVVLAAQLARPDGTAISSPTIDSLALTGVITSVGAASHEPLIIRPKGIGDGGSVASLVVSEVLPDLEDVDLIATAGMVLAGGNPDFFQWAGGNTYATWILASSGGTVDVPTDSAAGTQIGKLYFLSYKDDAWIPVSEIISQLDASETTKGFLSFRPGTGSAAEEALRLKSDKSALFASTATATDFIVGSTSIKPLRGTSASLGGGALLAGACATNATTVTGATTAMAVDVSPVTYPGAGATWDGYVSAADTVTTRVCAIVGLTPTASTYNIAVIP